MDISLRHLLDRYRDEHDLLQHVLKAKLEEDKKIAAQDTLKIEQARIHLRELDLELMREHGKATIRYYDKQHTTPEYITPAPPPTHLPPPLGMGNSVTTHATTTNTPTPAGPHTTLPPISSSQYNGLAPVQQQVLARITSSSSFGHTEAYPHSAHPLCPPSDPHAYRRNNRLYPSQQPATPISPGGALNGDDKTVRKRSRNSVNDLGGGGGGESGNTSSLTHVQVMEALKAKIQRGTNNTNSSNSNGSNSAHVDSHIDRTHSNGNSNSGNTSKRARTTATTAAPTIIKTEVDRDCIVSSTPSPRSAKPILPPIDTSVGRVKSSMPTTTNTAVTPTNNKSGNHQEQYHYESNNNRYHTISPAEHALREQSSSKRLVEKQDGSSGKNTAATATGPSSSSSSSSSSEPTTASSSS
ncbi:hypothetical protein BDB00DRAFT_868172 [Zychaea mexicana]|uniref:uncharacterized protein n=1 Tax=Zychaea mexicana TaxID=64656 RepID=UPI0022FE1847|nr:uncharacterized protein BDB00DRAFT_868172 [Zychaea mexicana]KAI9497575.1 hypothetical protein BDB00DRAFT_868172 [Zychaea mexicana]